MLVTSERYPGKYCTGPEAVAHIYPTTDILPQTSDTCIGVIFIPIFKEGIMKNHGHLAQPPALLVVWINPSRVRCDSA